MHAVEVLLHTSVAKSGAEGFLSVFVVGGRARDEGCRGALAGVTMSALTPPAPGPGRSLPRHQDEVCSDEACVDIDGFFDPAVVDLDCLDALFPTGGLEDVGQCA
jgi:hypothetical protein